MTNTYNYTNRRYMWHQSQIDRKLLTANLKSQFKN